MVNYDLSTLQKKKNDQVHLNKFISKNYPKDNYIKISRI